jgi:hypothetical protein
MRKDEARILRHVSVRWTAPSRSEEDAFSVVAQEESTWDATRELESAALERAAASSHWTEAEARGVLEAPREEKEMSRGINIILSIYYNVFRIHICVTDNR